MQLGVGRIAVEVVLGAVGALEAVDVTIELELGTGMWWKMNRLRNQIVPYLHDPALTIPRLVAVHHLRLLGGSETKSFSFLTYDEGDPYSLLYLQEQAQVHQKSYLYPSETHHEDK